MKKLIGAALICAMTASLISGCTPSDVGTVEPSETEKWMSGRPQDDFYYYANRDKLDNAEFKYGSAFAADAFDNSLIVERLENIVKDVAAGSGYEKGSEEYIIQTAYNTFISYDFDSEPVPEDLQNVIDEVMNAKTADELLMTDAKLYRDFGISGFFSLSASEDVYISGRRILTFYPFVSMCDVSFDSLADGNSALTGLVSDTRVYMQTLGYDVDTSSEYGKKLANLVLSVYGASGSKTAQDSYDVTDTIILSGDELNSIFTNIDIQEYFKAIGFDPNFCDRFGCYNKDQLICMNSLMVEDKLDALKALEIHKIYSSYMRFIAPSYDSLAGYVYDSYKPVEELAVNEIISNLKNETDPLYVERYYSKETDDALRSMCDDIREGYRALISDATWLTEPTRKGLIEKLDNIVYVTGTDLKRHDTSKFAGIGGNFYEFYMGYTRVCIADSIASLSRPVDRYEVGMAMQTVNACYSQTQNNITITVAIAGDSFFDVNGDYYTNLGNLGATIAHEMGHAFDSNCIVFDQNGVYNPEWIADEDMEALLERNEKAVRYFEDNFTVFGIYHVDGELTLGENFADLSGMECIVTLAHSNEDLEKIFKSYAASYCRMSVDVVIIGQLSSDVHSPEVIRVNAILSTTDCFYDVYDVKEGDGMYISPENRISRWH